jgi:ketopantoate reductase
LTLKAHAIAAALAGRPTEHDAVLGSVIELGTMTGTPTPVLSLVYHLVKVRERVATNGWANTQPR